MEGWDRRRRQYRPCELSIPLVLEAFGRASMSDLDNLIAAAKQGNLEQVNAILEADDSLVNQKDESGATPVHYAALNGHSHIVRLLVQRGADVNRTDSQYGATPAGWAIEYFRELGGHLRSEEHTSELQSPYDLVCRLLLEKKNNYNTTSQMFGLFRKPINKVAEIKIFKMCIGGTGGLPPTKLAILPQHLAGGDF